MNKNLVLFSPIGTSDPIRTNHDSGMLHIARHYQPCAIYFFLTAEIERYVADGRLAQAIESLQALYPDYQPQLVYLSSGIVNAADFDIYAQPFRDALERITSEHPKAEILLNISSGTAQMISTLTLNCNRRSLPYTGHSSAQSGEKIRYL